MDGNITRQNIIKKNYNWKNTKFIEKQKQKCGNRNNTKMNEWMHACMHAAHTQTHKAEFTIVSISVWIHHVKNMFRFSNDKKWHQEQRFNANHAMPYHGIPYYNVCSCSWYEMIRWMTAWNLCSTCIFYNVIFWIHKNVVYAVPLLWGWYSYFVILFFFK